MEVELAVEEEVGWDYLSEEGGEVGNDGRVVEVVVSGLEFAVEVEATDSVELWLDEKRVGDFGLVVGELVGKHWFHREESSGMVRGSGGEGLEKAIQVVMVCFGPRI